MPADGTHSVSRRSSRKISADDDIELRRARGEISCAECRRLKLKCDKKIPCGSCIRRGCPSICPNGNLTTGQGTSRFVLADTSQLHAKIAEMGQRIRQLEDALAIFQSSVSNDPHPLLRDDLLRIKFGPEPGMRTPKPPGAPEAPPLPIDALGTLTINDAGEGVYFGRSAGSETLFLAGADLDTTPPEDDLSFPVSEEIQRLSGLFPFTDSPSNMARTLDLLFDNLPDQPRAWALCETYLEQASWCFCPMPRDEIIDDFMIPIYKGRKDRLIDPTAGYAMSVHKLAVLFLLFAMGALVDLTLDFHNAEAEGYYHLGRAALASRSVFDSGEIATLQAIVLMGSYHGMGGSRYTIHSAWSLMSLGAKLAQSLGLHRDGARWNMDPKTVERRRKLFWEILCSEQSMSIALGRPPAIRLSYVDCEFPINDGVGVDEDGQPKVGYTRWRNEFVRDILSVVIENTLTAAPPSYDTILELDRKVREKSLPPHLNVFLNAQDQSFTPGTYMRGCVLGQYRSVALLYIHRSFFAQAMLDYPSNPLRSPYAPSFLAAYRCASNVIKSNLNHFDRFPDLCVRWWSTWTHLFSAAIIVGCIVTRAPSSTMAPSAFIELGLAYDMFQKGAVHSRRARSGFAILSKMRMKAFQAYSQYQAGRGLSKVELSIGPPDYGDEELALFGGHTRVLVSRLLSKRRREQNAEVAQTSAESSVQASPTSSNSPSAENDSRPPQTPYEIPEVHPSLVEYLALLPSSQYLDNISRLPGLNGNSRSSSSVGATAVSTPRTGNDITMSSPAISVPSWPPTMRSLVASTTQLDTNSMFFDFDHRALAVAEHHSPEDTGLMDLGMLTGGSGMDEQWVNFMRDTGFLGTQLSQSQTFGMGLG
ncbi:hypothetical protein FISHEDRAFT_75449 [Fistulina hepatica ATCC 64428]|uniref:Zn(2)-C6 fungal-type domain-containing protein n=1 Tax=Fistulina hepatica ATCC 64428 TaxID=1128425 RepID=A0A0D7A6H8_9AGAR|nr:hypothetical protein FISHEDRAFT_75449 [Fistulina hepatica ATCC 64428]